MRAVPFEDLPRPIETIDNFWIELADGCRLAARMWLPTDASQDPVPAILEFLPYRKDDGTAARDAPRHPFVAGHGYACVRVDMRGSGDSDGLLTDEYLPQEQQDAVEVIEWLAQQPWCTGRVGMMGISWGGFNSLQVAALRPPALGAVITLCSTDDRYADDVHYIGGAILALDMLRWSTSMLAFQSKPPDPAVVGDRWREMWLERLELPPWSHTWLAHQRRDAYWKHGSVCESYRDITVPVYAMGGWADGYTEAIFRLLAGLESPTKALIGPWGHAFPDEATPGPSIGFLPECIRWWDRWLKGIDNGIMDEPQVAVFVQEPAAPQRGYEQRPGHWVAERSWPPPDVTAERFYLGSHSLERTPQKANPIPHPIDPEHGLDAGAWCAEGATDLAPDQRIEDRRSLSFTSEPLEDDAEIVGAPELRLRVVSNMPSALVVARLCDVAADGTSALITRGVLNLTHRDDHEHPEALDPGRPYDIVVALATIAQVVPRAHRLRLSLSPGYWPWLWPSPRPVTLTVHPQESSVVLPLRPLSTDRPAPRFEEPVGTPPMPLVTLEHHPGGLEVHADPADDVIRLVHDWDLGGTARLPTGIVTSDTNIATFTIRRDDPASAEVVVECVSGFGRDDWWTEVEVRSVMTSTEGSFELVDRLTAYEDRATVFEKTWSASIPRDHG